MINLDELQRLYNDATPFDWVVETDGNTDEESDYLMILQKGSLGQNGQIAAWDYGELSQMRMDLADVRPDAAFIVAMRNALPELIREVRAGRELAKAVNLMNCTRYIGCHECDAASDWVAANTAALRQYQDSLK